MKRIFVHWTALFFGIFLLAGCDGRGNNNGLEIDTLAAEPSVVRPGESAVLTVSVDGEEGGLTYRWRAAAGALSARDTNPVTWTAPSTVGSVPIQVEVSSEEGMKATGFATMLVSVSPTGSIITSVNPSEAKAGSEIRITGAGFGTGEGGSLIVGGVTASGILSWNETEIRTLIPEGASTGSVKVVIGGVESSPGTLVVLWEKENPENVPLSTAVNEQLFPQLVSDGAAGAIVVWADLRNGLNTDVYAQRVNGSGAVLWAADGVPIAAAANNQSVPQLVSDGAGGAIITWEDNRTGTFDIYAQRVNRDGIAQWAENGVLVTGAANAQLSPQVIPDGSGGAILIWLDFRNGGTPDLFVQRINGEGVAQWGADGVPVSLAADAQQSPQLISDGAGGAIIVWQDHRNVTHSDIYAQRISGEGQALWTADGTAISTAANNQQFPQLISDDTGGATIVWQDGRSGTDKIFAQRVDGGGAALWTANGAPIAATANAQSVPQMISDGSGGALITWQDGTDIFAQRVNAAGALQWAAEGTAISTAANTQSFPRIVPDGAGGAIVTWTDRRGGTNDLYAQRVNSGGTVQWTANGVAVSTAAGDQSSGTATSPPQILPDGFGGAIMAWQDHRSGQWDIYAQGISAGGRL
ncbi:MAG: IPT/TIG domain-containing protein [Candidatus Manganitrophus sp. SA1]|nr:IPT/TIG domain-containing protein [Candidatus Manganitrophus morganii]